MKAHFVNSGRTSGVLRQFPAALLSRFEPGLFVDVGAAVGRMTKVMLKANPASRVIAYEPFAGNRRTFSSLRTPIRASPCARSQLPIATGRPGSMSRLLWPPTMKPSALEGALQISVISRGTPLCQHNVRHLSL